MKPGYKHLIQRQNRIPLCGKQRRCPPLKKQESADRQKKQMFIVFLDTEGVILCHGVPVGKTINSEYSEYSECVKYKGEYFEKF